MKNQARIMDNDEGKIIQFPTLSNGQPDGYAEFNFLDALEQLCIASGGKENGKKNAVELLEGFFSNGE